MRIFRSFVLFLTLILVTPFFSLQFVEAEEVVFEDPAIEQAVRQQLGISGSISLTDLDLLYALEVKEGTVTSLNGLEKALNLSQLSINNASVSDLAPLSSLSELVYVSLKNNRIQNIQPLSALYKLMHLDLSGNQISDISPLSSLNLMELYLASNPISKNTANKNTLLSLQQKGAQIDIKIEDTTTEQPSTPPKAEEETSLKWTKLYPELKDADYHSSEYAYGNKIYVSTQGYTSKNGINWTKNPKFGNIRMNVVAWGKGKFVGLGYRDNQETKVWISKDGLNWTENTEKIKHSTGLSDIAFNGTRFVAVGGHNTAGYIVTSEDGVKWTERTSNIKTDLKGIAWGNGTFVALGYKGTAFVVSKDGLTWKRVTVPVKDDNGMWDIHFAGGSFVAIGDSTLLTSKDGAKWTSVASDGIFWDRVIWVKDRFFIEGFKYADNKKETIVVFKTSKDGKTWKDITGLGPLTTEHYGTYGAYYHLNTVHDGKQYVTYTDIGIFISTDGVKWKQIKKVALKPPHLINSTVGNGKLVSVGGDVDYFYPAFEKLASRGVWSINAKGEHQSSYELGKFPLYDVIWTGSQFFAVGAQGLMMTSKDGVKWNTSTASPTKESLFRIIKANGIYYVTGSNGLIMSSKDLKTWKKQKTGIESDINSIAWSGKKFVAVGEYGVTLVSDNGTAWKTGSKLKSANGDFSYSLPDVVWGNGVFIITAAQYNNSDREYTIFKSTDGTKWARKNLEYTFPEDDNGLFPRLYGVRYFNNTFVAVGNNGSVYLSKNGDKWSREEVPDSVILLSVQLFNGKLYATGSYTDQIYIAEFKTKSK
ncbi:hypothetical protein [Paenibacillus sp. NEAU-GSW1]|uniref:hypothetical protein n=1 Tax=Paenibacillus sp. NEAU-GSW1 TaxID=2682486 RepID=UPI0012E1523E|nr:hypothetical protein [Paenibacillus sp. NEAU-GSW1]MUT64691.1 hypothetical protein [Paenibacillus sp. NEAU-GSW1]